MQVDTSRWACIYPAYLNKLLKVSQGRRVPLTIAVENPQIGEISEVLKFLQIHHALEPKAYPRDILQVGRVKIRLRDEAGNLVNQQIDSKKTLIKQLCQYIPRLKSRVEGEQQQQATTSSSKNKNKKNKNKNKNKRR